MDRSEAQKVLNEQLSQFRQRNYSELVALAESGHVENFKIRGPSGTNYSLEVLYSWEEKLRGAVRVLVRLLTA